MLVKCMLPISIVDNKDFREYIKYLDPSFNMPCRKTVKESILPKMRSQCQEKIKEILKNIPWPNTSMDAWTDSVVRPYNGYIAHGIDNDWNLHTLPIEFEYVVGLSLFILFNLIVHCSLFVYLLLMHNVGRHTGINIKSEYDKVVNFYDINNKVYKVIADQAANMKKAFEQQNVK